MRKILVIAILVAVLFTLVACSSSTGSPTKPQYSNWSFEELILIASSPSYDSLLKSNEIYVGTLVHYYTEVFQISQNADGSPFILAKIIDKDQFNVLCLNYPNNAFFEKDAVELVGIASGLETYPTKSGQNIVPKINVIQAKPSSVPNYYRMTFEELKQKATTPTYDNLFRFNETHVGELVYYKAEVVQVMELGDNNFVIRADITKGEYVWKDTVYLYYNGTRLLEDDIIEFVGIVKGLKTYTAVSGASITIPEIDAIDAQLYYGS